MMAAPAPGADASVTARRYTRIGAERLARLRTEDYNQPVMIADWSAAGAMLDLASPQSLPDKFELLVTGSGASDAPAIRCRLKWQKDRRAGVTFF